MFDVCVVLFISLAVLSNSDLTSFKIAAALAAALGSREDTSTTDRILLSASASSSSRPRLRGVRTLMESLPSCSGLSGIWRESRDRGRVEGPACRLLESDEWRRFCCVAAVRCLVGGVPSGVVDTKGKRGVATGVEGKAGYNVETTGAGDRVTVATTIG